MKKRRDKVKEKNNNSSWLNTIGELILLPFELLIELLACVFKD